MTEAEQAALDLLRDMRETLLSLHEANMEKNSEISSLKDQMAAFQTADAQLPKWRWGDAPRRPKPLDGVVAHIAGLFAAGFAISYALNHPICG